MRIDPLLLAGLLLAPFVSTQTVTRVADGYTHATAFEENSDPLAIRGFAVGDGAVFVALANEIVAVDAGGARTVLHRFGLGSGADLLEVFGTDLYFIETGTTDLYRRDLQSGAQVRGSVPRNTFDLARAPGGALLASANPDWPNPAANNGIWWVDPAGAAHREIIALQGPSGPMAFDARGDLCYAQQSDAFPSPSGSVRIVRFDRAALQQVLAGGAPLTLADGTPVLTGLDGAYGLAFDDRDRLYWSDPQRGGVQRTEPGAQRVDPTPLLAPPLPPDTSVALRLQFVDGSAATFDPYQPAAGGVLYTRVTDWGQRGEILAITPRRPQLAASPSPVVTPGVLRLSLSALPPHGAAWLCLTGAPPRPEQALFSWNGTPFWSALDMAVAPLCVALRADAAGAAQLVLQHPGGVSVTAHLQAVGVAPSVGLWPFGTSSIVSLDFRP